MELTYPLRRSFLVRVLGLILRDPTFGARIVRATDYALMPSEETRRVFEALTAHMLSTGGVADAGLLKQRLYHQYHLGQFTEQMLKDCERLVDLATRAEFLARDDAKEVLKEAILGVSVGSGLDAALRAYKRKEYDGVQKAVDAAYAKARLLEFGPEGRLMSRDLEQYTTDIADGKARVERIPMGVAPLDEQLCGGLGRGELGCVLAWRKGGKSQWLSHVAQTAVLAGKFVVYLSFELGGPEVENRITSGLTDIATNTIAYAGKTYRVRERIASRVNSKVAAILAATGGDYYVDGFGSKSMTVRDISLYLVDVVESVGRPIDVLIVDYADELLSNNRNDDMYSRLDEIYGDLRALGAAPHASYASKYCFNCAVWTASQITREGATKGIITGTDVDKSIEKLSKVDLMLSINSDAQEKALNMARIYVVACRYAPGGRDESDVFGPYETDFAYGRMFSPSDVERGVRWERDTTTVETRTSPDVALSQCTSGLSRN